MKSFELKGTFRTEVGKKSTNELRKNNGIPCILYDATSNGAKNYISLAKEIAAREEK